MSYTLLKEEEEAGITVTQDTRSLPTYTTKTSRTRALSKIVALILLVVAASFLGGLFALLGYRVPTFAIPSSSSSSSSSSSPTSPFFPKSTPHKITELQCGTSPAEARSLGCVLDLLAMSWVRPACYDKELTEEFLAVRNWTWTTDPWGKHHLSKSEVLNGDWEYVYVDHWYHVTHCAFMWRRMARAVHAGNLGVLDSYTAAYDHIEHCGDRLVANTGEEVVGVPAILKYPSCGPGSLGQEPPAYWIYEGEVQYNTKKQEGLYADQMKMEE
ncbi:uncharacterized protein BO88DRAFT_464744 [Aspergillus vadensis CBS 113365]|uniref:Uncharacterized protein n=1 Tax=Aspergillus vadensis (strain CBS 113365 / IMI 142717 / IBT 24658) TaxID=1448311 RepID=A0A319B7V4_ASPVC|nr:hypothetical protein BO88DRAFT_464744 [Aspergillus vadensis CBS 113365]PYH67941.1 hypothetical protein BO88DRAFT_464744 [Aspergillus vadensis CBS 113365]